MSLQATYNSIRLMSIRLLFVVDGFQLITELRVSQIISRLSANPYPLGNALPH